MNRRTFLRAGAAGLAGAALAPLPASAAFTTQPATPRFQTAVKYGMVDTGGSIHDRFALLKTLGFDGVEMDSPNELDRDEVLAAREATGLAIHGVVDSAHWRQPLSDADPAVRRAGLAALQTALDDAKAYGASTVLLVPAVVTKDVSYDDAWTRSQEAIREVLPMAEAHGVRIAVENVWNHFLMSPLETARYLDAFENPWIGAYFDVGNVVNYGWPEQWIRILGPRILKVDVKEYSRAKRNEEGPYAGFRVPLGEGDCDWPAVREAFEEVGYTGWATAELPGGDAAYLHDVAERMRRVLQVSSVE